MAEQTRAVALRPVDKLKLVIGLPTVQEQFENALGEARSLFVASLIDTFGSSKELQECEPDAVIKEALKAAVLRLPLAKGLGFAWIVPRRDHGVWTPQMQVGAKGWVQLAMRSGQYRWLNVGTLVEGESVTEDRLTGAITITGKPKGEDAPAVGFFAFFELLNGMRKALYWSVAKMAAHRDRYVPKWDRPGSAWVTHTRDMGEKTIISTLLRKWGVLSVEMQQAAMADAEGESETDPVVRQAETRIADAATLPAAAEKPAALAPPAQPTEAPAQQQTATVAAQPQAGAQAQGAMPDLITEEILTSELNRAVAKKGPGELQMKMQIGGPASIRKLLAQADGQQWAKALIAEARGIAPDDLPV